MENKILVETSARHVHVTQETLEILFGKGHELSPFAKCFPNPANTLPPTR